MLNPSKDTLAIADVSFLLIIKLDYQAHEADPVSGLVGLNSSTGGTTKDGNKWGIVKGTATVISGAETTAHNCYGVGTEDCSDKGLLKEGRPLNWEPVYRPKETIENSNWSHLNQTTVTE